MKPLRFERFLKHPPERVWIALTNPEWLANWYMENDFSPIIGHRFRFQTDPAPGFDGILYGEVLEVEEPHRLVYTFKGGNMRRETIVTWTLTPTPEGTQLILEHSGFSGLRDVAIRGILGFGWWRFLRRLPKTLSTLQNEQVSKPIDASTS